MSTAASPYFVPHEPGRWRALTLAAIVHVALIAFLWIGVHWQNETPIAVEAEIWDMQNRDAAPKPLQSAPVDPKIEKPVAVKSTPKLPVKTEETQQERLQEKAAKVEIALEQEKKRKAALLLAAETKKADAAKQKKEAEDKANAQKLSEKNAESAKNKKDLQDKELAQKLAEQKAEIAKRKKELEEQESAQKLAIEKLEKKKLADQQKAKEAADQQALENDRDADMKRLLNQAGSGGTGDAPKAMGARGDPNYKGMIIHKIKSNLSYGGDTNVSGNPQADFTITQLPTGEIVGLKITKSSGVPAYDDAVEKAIRKSSPLPRRKDGTVDREITATFKLKESN
ncbi:MAG: cell envelope integrity protein TolA [Pseudomonadota bacterium]